MKLSIEDLLHLHMKRDFFKKLKNGIRLMNETSFLNHSSIPDDTVYIATSNSSYSHHHCLFRCFINDKENPIDFFNAKNIVDLIGYSRQDFIESLLNFLEPTNGNDFIWVDRTAWRYLCGEISSVWGKLH